MVIRAARVTSSGVASGDWLSLYTTSRLCSSLSLLSCRPSVTSSLPIPRPSALSGFPIDLTLLCIHLNP